MKDSLSGRKDYSGPGLEVADLKADPFEQLRLWLADAADAGVEEPNAMGLSTMSADGAPSSRMVLLRQIDTGLCFYTNYASRKGRELEAVPRACGLFWWGALNRQVRVEGMVERTSAEMSDAYFHSRPLDSRLASAVSPQSEIIADKAELLARIEELALLGEVRRPEHWGGYRLIPSSIEFWQGGYARLHDRILYRREGEAWVVARLAP